MVTLETHQSQELQVPTSDTGPSLDPSLNLNLVLDPGLDLGLNQDSGPNAITVLTLLDKLVLMLDTVQRDQHNMEVHQVQMEGVVRGIQADMTKLSKSHSHTANTVSKLLDKSRKLSVTMKEVRAQMEKQGTQVKKLEANHAHLIDRNQFRVLIFQDQTEIPSSVFIKDQPPFPRDEITEEGEEPEKEGAGLHTIDLSSDEEAGLEAELEDDWTQDLEQLENMEPTRAEKLKRSSLKKVDSLKKAFSKQSIEKKMTKIGTKLVSVEQRQKLKLKSPVSFGMKKSRGSVEIPVETTLEAVAETGGSFDLFQDEAPSVGHEEQEVPLELDQSHDQSLDQSRDQSLDPSHDQSLDPSHDQSLDQSPDQSLDQSLDQSHDQSHDQSQESAEGVSADYALSSTLPQDQEPDQDPDQSTKVDLEKDLEEEPEKKQEPEEMVRDEDQDLVQDPVQDGAKAEE